MAEGAEAILDELRDHPEWSEAARDGAFDRMIQSADLSTLETLAVRRLNNLALGDGEAILRLIEAVGSDDLLTALGQALLGQPELSAERDWHGLSILADAERLGEWPDLAERFAELVEIFEEADSSSVEEWASTMLDDPDGVWVALHGLAMVEPEVRPSIVSSLSAVPLNPGLVEFLQVLADGTDDDLGRAARGVLQASSQTSIQLANDSSSTISRMAPGPGRCLVTDLNGDGRGYIMIATKRDVTRIVVFECDVKSGIVQVNGQETHRIDLFDELAGKFPRNKVIDQPELAVGLLAGIIGIGGPEIPPAAYSWIDLLLGHNIEAKPFPGTIEGFDPASTSHPTMPLLAAQVLDALPDWVDRSTLTDDLATEIAARAFDDGPDPVRDAGAYRYLFTHRLADQLETYRRMLFWMAAFWNAGGQANLARSALTSALRLSDPQHAVPANAFVVELTTRSLKAAMAKTREQSSMSTPSPRRRGS